MVIKNLFTALACIVFTIASTGCATTKSESRSIATTTIQDNLDDISGSYKLIAVNGATIPATVSHGDAEIMVHSGVFMIKADGTCSSKTTFSPPSGGKVT